MKNNGCTAGCGSLQQVAAVRLMGPEHGVELAGRFLADCFFSQVYVDDLAVCVVLVIHDDDLYALSTLADRFDDVPA